tara:strand:- start:157 stop:459 length:303 start_codon:yes stop_codon:yes gene_type:complete
MEFHRKSMFSCRLEHPFRLGQIEPDSLAEGIDGVGKSLLCNFADHFPADQVDVIIAPSLELRWKGMGAEKTGGNTDRQFTFQLPCDPEHAAFGFGFQPVS